MNVMRIRELRETAGMTQTQFATSLGTNQCTISAWENEVYLPKSRDLPRLANVLGCTIQDLFAPEADADKEYEEE